MMSHNLSRRVKKIADHIVGSEDLMKNYSISEEDRPILQEIARRLTQWAVSQNEPDDEIRAKMPAQAKIILAQVLAEHRMKNGK
jgi:hypothetical protein